jgi:hypothetical protein
VRSGDDVSRASNSHVPLVNCLLIVSKVKSSAFKMARNIEFVLMECINTGTDQASSVLPNILSHFGNDIDGNRLQLHLSMLSDLCHCATPRISVAYISDVIQVFNNNAWAQMLASRGHQPASTLPYFTSY